MRLAGLRGFQIACVLLLAATLCAQDAAWKRRNDKGNRYEGTVTRPHAARNYELRGFFAYRENFPLDDKTKLSLKFFLPSNEKAFVSAKEIREDKQYLMLAKEESLTLHPGGWSTFAEWGAQELRKNRVPPENLGVIVRLKNDAEYNEEIAPAILTSSGDPSAIAEYTLFLSIGVRLKNMEYQVTAAGYDQTTSYRAVEAKSVVPIRFPAGPLPAGPVTLQIRGDVANSLTEKLSARFRFYHKPL